MSDHDAIEAITATLDRHFRGEQTQDEAFREICKISGRNVIAHQAAKEAAK